MNSKRKESFNDGKTGIYVYCTCIRDSFDALIFSKRNIFDAFQQLKCIYEISKGWVVLGYANHPNLQLRASYWAPN